MTVNSSNSTLCLSACRTFRITNETISAFSLQLMRHRLLDISYSTIKTYSTYKETTYSGRATNDAPVHRCSFQRPSSWISTKKTDFKNTLIIGWATGGTATELFTFTMSMVVRFHCCYKDSRVDTGYINT